MGILITENAIELAMCDCYEEEFEALGEKVEEPVEVVPLLTIPQRKKSAK